MPTTLAITVANDLRSRIVSGALTPGERLPSETEISGEHGVSRTVVREAIGRLRAEGLVRSARGSGTYVLAVPVSDAAGSQSKPDPFALLEFRIAVEPVAAALAAQRRNTADLAAIEAALAGIDAAGVRASSSLQADYRLHQVIASASGNSYLARTLTDLGPAMIGMPAVRITGDGEHSQTVRAEHAAVVGAIRDGDSASASAAMTWHLTRTLQEIRRGHGSA